MSIVGDAVISIIMLCALAGAVAAIFNEREGLGREFLEGIHSIGHIFVPVAGIMASIPFLEQLVESVFGPAFSVVGADSSMAATFLIAVDMGGYQLARALALGDAPSIAPDTAGNWMMAMCVGYMAGATIVFSIPVGLAMLDRSDHKYLALGVLSGILSIPAGVLISSILIAWLGPDIRGEIAAASPSAQGVALSPRAIATNLAPLLVSFAVCAAFLFGDHLSFTANFQPNMIVPVLAGKLGGGIVALLLAHKLSVPRALELEASERLDADATNAGSPGGAIGSTSEEAEASEGRRFDG